MPVFVAGAAQDLIIPAANSWQLFRRISNTHLEKYPDLGHGFLYQYAEVFAGHVREFLDGGIEKERLERGLDSEDKGI